MKATELIERLTKLVEEHGDGEVTIDIYEISKIEVHHWLTQPIVEFQLY